MFFFGFLLELSDGWVEGTAGDSHQATLMNLSSLLCLQCSSHFVFWAFVSSALCASLQVGFCLAPDHARMFFCSLLEAALERNPKIGYDWTPLMILIFQFFYRVEGLSSLSCGLLRRFANGFSIQILMRLKHEAVFISFIFFGKRFSRVEILEWRMKEDFMDHWLVNPNRWRSKWKYFPPFRTFTFVKLSPNDIEFMSRSDAGTSTSPHRNVSSFTQQESVEISSLSTHRCDSSSRVPERNEMKSVLSKNQPWMIQERRSEGRETQTGELKTKWKQIVKIHKN